MEVSGNPLCLVIRLKNVKKAPIKWLKEEKVLPNSKINASRDKLQVVHDTLPLPLLIQIFTRRKNNLRRNRLYAWHMKQVNTGRRAEKIVSSVGIIIPDSSMQL